MKSPFNITYSDLIKEEEQQLANMKARFPSLVRTGQMNDWVAKRKIALQEQLVKMLKKHRKDPQLNLNDLFDKV